MTKKYSRTTTIENMPTSHPSNSSAQDSIVEIDRLTFSFGSHQVFDQLSLNIPRNGVTVIMGPSGCGKSTLLNFIGARQRSLPGQVSVNGRDTATLKRRQIYQLRREMGMMFQHNALLTDLSVFENIAFPLREHTRLNDRLINHLVLMKLQMVGLRGARDLMPVELSGGMARRVALARAIALDPALVMYDEPFTGLDPISMGIIVKLIRELTNALDMTSLVVTHDVAEGMSIADYVFILGYGGVLGQGTPQQIKQSDDPQVKQFINGLPDGPVAYHYPAAAFTDDLLSNGEIFR